jgi:hypothetical protein
MAHPLSLLGIAHTAVSLVPVVAGVTGFARHRMITPGTRSGGIYLVGLTISVLTAFGLSSTGGFNPGHALGILALLAAFGSLLVPRLSFLGRLRPYLATFGLSFSFFLLMVPAINETLTRLPAAHPLAEGPQSPLVRATLLAWVVTFIVGFALQVWTIRRASPQSPA